MASKKTVKRTRKPSVGADKSRCGSEQDAELAEYFKESARRFALTQPRRTAAEERADAIAGIQRGLDDVKAGRVMSMREAIDSIRAGGKPRVRPGSR